MSVIDSHNKIIRAIDDYGAVNRMLQFSTSAGTTAATASSGLMSVCRHPTPVNIFGGTTSSPALGTNVLKGYLSKFYVYHATATTMSMLGIDTLLGTVTANGGTGTFADGSVMPTKTIRIQGSDNVVATGASVIYAAVTTVMVGAGSYTLTITYTNQDGVGSRTATLTIPNVAAVNSAFAVAPHLQSGDTGITDITNVTLTGTSGVIKIYGVLPLGWAFDGGANNVHVEASPLAMKSYPMIPIESTDMLTLYRLNGTNAFHSWCHITIIPSDS